MTRSVAVLVLFAMLGCARPAPLDPAHVDVCTLATRGAELDGQRVSLRAIANFTHEHGIFLTDNACRDELISFDTTPNAHRSPYLAQGDRNVVPFQDAVLDLSGIFHWAAARNPETGAQDRPKTLVVDEIRSLTFVPSRLGNGCEQTGRSRQFCDCLESNLGVEPKPEYQRALEDIMMADGRAFWSGSSGFRALVASVHYDSGATRAAFTQCAARASR